MCGRKPKGYVHSKYSKKCESLLSTLLNISVTTESDDIFPPVVCNSCYITVKKAKEDDTNILTTTIGQFAWEAHNDLCEICLEVGGDSSGGRPRGRGRGDQGMMNQLFSVEKLWKELVILTHLNLRISHLTRAVSNRWTGLLEWTTGMDYWNGL